MNKKSVVSVCMLLYYAINSAASSDLTLLQLLKTCSFEALEQLDDAQKKQLSQEQLVTTAFQQLREKMSVTTVSSDSDCWHRRDYPQGYVPLSVLLGNMVSFIFPRVISKGARSKYRVNPVMESINAIYHSLDDVLANSEIVQSFNVSTIDSKIKAYILVTLYMTLQKSANVARIFGHGYHYKKPIAAYSSYQNSIDFEAVLPPMDVHECNLSGNLLTRIGQENFFYNCRNLTAIDLSHNLIRTLPVGLFYDLSKLTSINLSNNLLTNVPDFTHNHVLSQVDLSLNELEELPTIQHFSPLVTSLIIDCRHNPHLSKHHSAGFRQWCYGISDIYTLTWCEYTKRTARATQQRITSWLPNRTSHVLAIQDKNKSH